MHELLASVTKIDMGWYVTLMVLGTIQLGLAAFKFPEAARWSWLAGGALFIAVAQFFALAS